ncbi:hypothetical protein [Nocardioides sp.]|uniref:hypothetical protein n=1 Tax=Nocardioides sp. TaxID=35761 RepID=UPI002719555F|nr:hypothetical protein [Nocardioides sp.]MDO9456392.1 hypothetical protein [Nocardioides sp.]
MTRHPSPAWLALFVVLVLAGSGTSYAAGKAQAGDVLVRKGSLSGNRLKPDTVTGKQVAEGTLGRVPRAALADRTPALARLPLPLGPGWEGAQYLNNAPTLGKDAQGWVRLEGAVARTEGTGATIATLPVGYRPTANIYVTVFSADSTLGALRIEPGGAVVRAFGDVGLMSLENISFRAAP